MVKLVLVVFADDAKGLVKLMFLFIAPTTLVMLLAALDWLVSIDVALVGEGYGQLDSRLGPQQLKVDWPAAFGGHCEISHLRMDWEGCCVSSRVDGLVVLWGIYFK